MSKSRLVTLVSVLASFAATAHAQPTCTATPISDQQVKTIVDKERSTRSDLPRPFDAYTWVVRKQECHYVYVESAVPAGPERSNMLTLNQDGVVVDVQPGSMQCPEPTIRAEDIPQKVRALRTTRSDLPAPFPQAKTTVSRRRCGYMYVQYGQSETKQVLQIFAFDLFGELTQFVRPRSF